MGRSGQSAERVGRLTRHGRIALVLWPVLAWAVVGPPPAAAQELRAPRAERAAVPAVERLSSEELRAFWAEVDDRDPWRLDADVFSLRAPVSGALERGDEVRERPFPLLPGESATRSRSIGTVTTGYVVRARTLEAPGPHHDILPRQRLRNLNHGTDELVAMIEQGAADVARAFPGSTLWVGNIGRRAGGDIPYSVSHNAGRDADLAFYSTDPSGRLVDPPGLMRFDDRGRSLSWQGYYRFDVARNWVLVRSLVTSPHAQVQFLFISNGLRALLLDHARALGEDPSIIDRAALVLRQPGAEIPHDDHLHLRIYCGPDDVASGCINTGRVHPGIDRFEAARRGAIGRARSALRDADAGVRARAIERLVVLRAVGERENIALRLGDPSPGVRRAAAVAIGALGDERHASWLAARLDEETSAQVRDALIRSLGAVGGAGARAALVRRLPSEQAVVFGRKGWDERMVVLSALDDLDDVAVIPEVAALLGVSDAFLVARARDVLARLANHDPAWIERSGTPAVDAWIGWWAEQGGAGPGVRLAGFQRAGVDLSGGVADRAAELARAAGDERPWLRINAQRRLMEKTGNTPASLSWPARDARTYWTRWVRRNPGRLSALAR